MGSSITTDYLDEWSTHELENSCFIMNYSSLNFYLISSFLIFYVFLRSKKYPKLSKLYLTQIILERPECPSLHFTDPSYQLLLLKLWLRNTVGFLSPLIIPLSRKTVSFISRSHLAATRFVFIEYWIAWVILTLHMALWDWCHPQILLKALLSFFHVSGEEEQCNIFGPSILTW